MASDLVGKARVLLEADTRGFHRDLDSAEKKAHASGRAIKAGLVAGLAGATAAFYAVGKAAKVGFDEFEQGQRVAAQTAAVIKSTGGAANVTAKEIEKLGKSLMLKSGIDDEAIKSGENLLLTFTSIRNEVGKGNDIFNRATKATLDLSVAFHKDMNSSAILVGKALQDPIKGLTALGRVGVQFTAQQKEQIKALVESGHAMDAQKIILKTLETQTKGSAEALGQTFGGQINILRERLNNFLGDLVGKAMPGMTRLLHQFTDSGSALREHLAPALETVKELFGVVGDYLRETWWPIIQQIFGIFSAAVGRIAAVVREHMPQIQQTFRNLGVVVQNLWAVAGPILRLLFEQVLPRAIGIAIPILLGVSRVIRGVSEAFRLAIKGILTAVDWFLGGIQALAQAASKIPFIGPKFDGVADAVGRARARVRQLRDDIDNLKGGKVTVLVNLRYNASPNAPGRPGDGIIGADGIMPIVEKDIDAFGQRTLAQSAGRTAFAGRAANPGGLVNSILDDLALAQSFGLHLTSGYRPGAITSSGNRSLHSTGQAIDVAGSPSSMAGYARSEAGRPSVAEIIYSPVGWWHPGAGWGPVTDATIKRDHYSHVHVGVSSGDGLVGAGMGTTTRPPVGQATGPHGDIGLPFGVYATPVPREILKAIDDAMRSGDPRELYMAFYNACKWYERQSKGTRDYLKWIYTSWKFQRDSLLRFIMASSAAGTDTGGATTGGGDTGGGGTSFGGGGDSVLGGSLGVEGDQPTQLPKGLTAALAVARLNDYRYGGGTRTQELSVLKQILAFWEDELPRHGSDYQQAGAADALLATLKDIAAIAGEQLDVVKQQAEAAAMARAQSDAFLAHRGGFMGQFGSNIFSPDNRGLQLGSTPIGPGITYNFNTTFLRPPPDSFSWLRNTAFAAGR